MKRATRNERSRANPLRSGWSSQSCTETRLCESAHHARQGRACLPKGAAGAPQAQRRSPRPSPARHRVDRPAPAASPPRRERARDHQGAAATCASSCAWLTSGRVTNTNNTEWRSTTSPCMSCWAATRCPLSHGSAPGAATNRHPSPCGSIRHTGRAARRVEPNDAANDRHHDQLSQRHARDGEALQVMRLSMRSWLQLEAELSGALKVDDVTGQEEEGRVDALVHAHFAAGACRNE